MPDLTPKQQRVLDWITEFWLQHGYPPTVREIGAAFEIKSPNGVMCHLRALHEKGALTWTDGDARSIVTVDCEGYLRTLRRTHERRKKV